MPSGFLLDDIVPTLDPAGQDPALRDLVSPAWPPAKVIPGLNTIWLQPGMYMESGTGFGGEGASSAAQQFAGGPGFAFPSLSFTQPGQPEGGAFAGSPGGSTGTNWMSILGNILGLGSKFLKGGGNPADILGPSWTPEKLQSMIDKFYGTGLGGPNFNLTGQGISPSPFQDGAYNLGFDSSLVNPALMDALDAVVNSGLPDIGAGAQSAIQNYYGLPDPGFNLTGEGLGGALDAANYTVGGGADSATQAATGGSTLGGLATAAGGAAVGAAAGPIADALFAGRDAGKAATMIAPWVYTMLTASGPMAPAVASLALIALPAIRKLAMGGDTKVKPQAQTATFENQKMQFLLSQLAGAGSQAELDAALQALGPEMQTWQFQLGDSHDKSIYNKLPGQAYDQLRSAYDVANQFMQDMKATPFNQRNPAMQAQINSIIQSLGAPEDTRFYQDAMQRAQGLQDFYGQEYRISGTDPSGGVNPVEEAKKMIVAGKKPAAPTLFDTMEEAQDFIKQGGAMSAGYKPPQQSFTPSFDYIGGGGF